MTIKPTDLETLRCYAAEVIPKPDIDAGGVKAITLALLGGLLWKGIPGSIAIERHAGDLEPTLWASLDGRRLAFAYNHQTEAIEMREGTIHGHPLRSFSNRTLLEDIDFAFERP